MFDVFGAFKVGKNFLSWVLTGGVWAITASTAKGRQRRPYLTAYGTGVYFIYDQKSVFATPGGLLGRKFVGSGQGIFLFLPFFLESTDGKTLHRREKVIS